MSESENSYIKEVISESENSEENNNFPKESDFQTKTENLEYKYLNKKRYDYEIDESYDEKEKLIKEIKKIEDDFKKKEIKLIEENKKKDEIIKKMDKTIKENLEREKENEIYYIGEVNFYKTKNDETFRENMCLYDQNHDQREKINELEKKIKEKDNTIEEQKELIKNLDEEIEQFKKNEIMLTCPVCYFNYKVSEIHIIIECCHIICKKCGDLYINSKNDNDDSKKCPLCRTKCQGKTKKINY